MKKFILAAAAVVVLTSGWLLSRPRAVTSPSAEASQSTGMPALTGVEPRENEGGSPAAASRRKEPEFSAGLTGKIPWIPSAALAPNLPADRRSWDPGWLQGFAGKQGPVPIRFELTSGEMAEGEVRLVQSNGDEVIYVAGRLSAPGEGSFFFRKQSLPGLAGSHVGVVQLPESGRAFRLEPSALDGTPDLVARRMDEVVCLRYAMPSGHGEPAPVTSPDTTIDADAGSASSDPQEAPFVDVGQHPTLPIPDYQNGVPVLESLPGARGVLYMDFDGETTTQWNGNRIVARRPAFTASQVREIWRKVCSDFTSFTVNLTTDLRVYERAAENSRVRVIITPTTDAAPGAGGVAFIGSWNWTGDTPCWVFGSTVDDAVEQIAHEVGHTLGLSHDGRPNEEYYGGHGSGETSWAPIMGVGYGKSVTQWSKGEYTNASNKEDDLAKIVNGNTAVSYRPDDVGNTFAAGGTLELFPGGVVNNRGIIERNTDIDSFRFTTLGGQVNLSARPSVTSPDLAIRLDLTDDDDQVLLTVNPTTTVRAVLSTNLPAGSYALKVRGSGRGANATTGFTAYASLGYYQITGTVVQGVEPVRLSVAENSPDGTVVADLNAFASSPGPRMFQATGGNGVGPFALASAGELTVALSSQLNFETREQFDLLVDILYPDNPLLNETNRRVVVQIEDVNEAPAVAVTTLRVFDHTRAGTPVGAATSSDPDLYSRLRYAIVAGDDAGWFDVDGSGELRLPRDLNSGPTVFHLRMDAWDTGEPVKTNSVEFVVEVLSAPSGLVPGAIAYARYDGITGTSMASLTNNARFPASPTRLTLLSTAETPFRDADEFGGVLRGYFLPPVTGSYNFAVGGDDSTELRLSTSDQPSAARRIAFSSSATTRGRWTQNGSQRSAAIALEAGQAYYLEARVKEGDGEDYLAVAWSSAAAGVNSYQVIPGRYLAPFNMNFAPAAQDQSLVLHRDAFAGARFGRIEAQDANGETAFTYRLVSASIPGLASVDESTGWLRVADGPLLTTTPGTSFTLRVRVTDPGGLRSTGNVTCRLVAPATVAATTPAAELFNNIGGGNTIPAFTNLTRFPGRPDTLKPLVGSFALDRNFANNYGSRVRAILKAPASGSYRFSIASDDNSELWLGTGPDASSARIVARVNGAVGAENWTAQTGQRSAAINLTVNQRYYIETRHKEGSGDDHLSVGWTRPGQTTVEVIPVSALSPVNLGYPPEVGNASAAVVSGAAEGTVVAHLDATDSSLDLLAWRLAGGDDEGIFSVDPDDGAVTVVNRDALLASAQTRWDLRMEVQDSGYGDLYPRRKATAILSLSRVAGGSPFEEWAKASGIPGALAADDSDGDGANNELEFAFGGDPKAADAAALHPRLSVAMDGGNPQLILTYHRRQNPAGSGLTYVPETTTLLAGTGWQPAVIDGQTTSVPAGIKPGYEKVAVRLADTVPSGSTIRFLRIQVTLQ